MTPACCYPEMNFLHYTRWLFPSSHICLFKILLSLGRAHYGRLYNGPSDPCLLVSICNLLPHHRVLSVLVEFRLSIGGKKCTTWESWVKCYLGQNEDYSLGDSLSALRNCSEEVEGQYYIRFFWSGVCAIKHIFCHRLIVSNMEQMSLLMILVLF